MAEKKMETVNIGDYLVAKNGKTKYIKLQAFPKADDKTKKLVEDIKKLIGGDILFVNLFDSDFKDRHNIPDFAKGRISVEVKEGTSSSSSSKDSKDEVDF